ncbi:MAG TPA: uracil-DNA glycosylase [Firmicutes bacterium]|nr:uracil-DNA glycosylase [Bacillota bacterium]
MNEKWNALEARCKACKACPLWETRTNVVFGDGNPDTDLMFIGEGPGQQEDLTGRAFVGRAGQLLDKFLAAVDLDRSMVYIGNMVKCRPPQNRDPKPEETESCIGFLREQVRIIRPKIIVCLGRIAACRLIDPGFKVTRQHGEWIEKGGIRFMGTFHPAALLRNPGQKPAAFEDFLKIRAAVDELQAEKA